MQNAASLKIQIVYFNKDMLLCSVIIAGWDEHEGGEVYLISMCVALEWDGSERSTS